MTQTHRSSWRVPIVAPPRRSPMDLQPNCIQIRISTPSRYSRELSVALEPIEALSGSYKTSPFDFKSTRCLEEPMPRRRPARIRELAEEVERQLATRSGPVWAAVLSLCEKHSFQLAEQETALTT